MPRKRRWMLFIEYCLLAAGGLLLGAYIAARIHTAVTSRAALKTLEESSGESRPEDIATASKNIDSALPADFSAAADQSLWSKRRIRAYKKATSRPAGTPLAILRIPRLQLEVPVLEGTDRVTLNSGVGRIRGTAAPGEAGNIGIAGHRDGFFRGLKEMEKGDSIQLVAGQAAEEYIVDRILITVPDDVSVLRSHDTAELTLVTCYPFYFVGPAPKRFIVHASLKQK